MRPIISNCWTLFAIAAFFFTIVCPESAANTDTGNDLTKSTKTKRDVADAARNNQELEYGLYKLLSDPVGEKGDPLISTLLNLIRDEIKNGNGGKFIDSMKRGSDPSFNPTGWKRKRSVDDFNHYVGLEIALQNIQNILDQYSNSDSMMERPIRAKPAFNPTGWRKRRDLRLPENYGLLSGLRRYLKPRPMTRGGDKPNVNPTGWNRDKDYFVSLWL
ncbi:unnamed protein product [Owenia fusiformis]|uniref:Uncharacterized protein n=1 Tax=Owenia fusiformis TaxID=6347 RepID=A0A8J1Y3I0_OWEFU|nr:unnamed protein product [Owenia fusiformis]